MSVQLIVYPQNYDGEYNAISTSPYEVLVNGINFAGLDTTSSYDSSAGALGSLSLVDAINNQSPSINAWKRYRTISSGTPALPTQTAGNLVLSSASTASSSGVYQKLTNLTIGQLYTITINSASLPSGNYQISYFNSSNNLVSFGTAPVISTSFSWTFPAPSNEVTVFISYYNTISSTWTITDLSIQPQGTSPTLTNFELENGQVICDLYEDEDMPLSLSVDNFKNVAEKIQSYSKAFKLPATKRNNRIFDNMFEITRSDDGIIFNPYNRTECVLKQDGFILFKGYLRMLDINDKDGEISYNVTLYSEVVALADILKDRTFSLLDFTELEHDYNKTQIKASWNDSVTGITYTNPSTSGFRNAYSTVKYPFVDWSHQFIVAAAGGTPTTGNPELPSLESAFKPFIQLKYLINRIFAETPFTWESTFFDSADFEKLYMDFNWGSNDLSSSPSQGSYITTTLPFIYSTTTYTNFILDDLNFTSDLNYDNVNHRFVALNNNTQYNLDINLVSAYMSGVTGMNFRLVHKDNSGAILNTFYTYFNQTSNFPEYILSQNVLLQQNDTLQVEWKSDVANNYIQYPANGNHIIATTGGLLATTNSMMQTLRGELKQWEFLKGIMTMFNLVSLPDEDNPNNIKFETYGDIFIQNTSGTTLADRSIQHDWTDRIDVSEMKLTPLTDLNKDTIFKFVEDDDDFCFMEYKRQVGGHLYGSKKFDASLASNGLATVLQGTEEIVAEPFAATISNTLMPQYSGIVVPKIYASSDDETEGFDNSPRILYNNGIKDSGITYYIPAQNGLGDENQEDYLQFSHLTDLYWLPYYQELYNPDTRAMTIKVNLSPSIINTFKFNDTVMIKNREFRVNKIDYKPNDLATVEFILIP
jgi:hypothetical protein